MYLLRFRRACFTICIDNARYCLIRLILRKPDQWHALSSLGGYKKEVGEVGLIRAITDLCRPWHEVMNGAREELGADAASGVQNEVQQAVGLVSDSSFEEVGASMCQNNNAEAGPSNASTRSSPTLSDSDFPVVDQSFQEDLLEIQLGSFCYDESTMDITELLNRLSVKQLKELVKETKSKPSKSTVRL
jgi:Fanconi-associated nuclease 1